MDGNAFWPIIGLKRYSFILAHLHCS